MNHRRILFLLFLLGFLPFSCFRPKYPYYEICDIKVETYKDKALKTNISISDSIVSDSVFFALILDTKYLSQWLSLNSMNGLYAMKKPSNGDYGLKDNIKSLNFYSDKTFADRSPGSNLNDLLKWVNWSAFKEVGDLYGHLNGNAPTNWPETEASEILYLTQPPGTAGKHNFTFELVYESGRTQLASVALIWK